MTPTTFPSHALEIAHARACVALDAYLAASPPSLHSEPARELARLAALLVPGGVPRVPEHVTHPRTTVVRVGDHRVALYPPQGAFGVSLAGVRKAE